MERREVLKYISGKSGDVWGRRCRWRRGGLARSSDVLVETLSKRSRCSRDQLFTLPL